MKNAVKTRIMAFMLMAVAMVSTFGLSLSNSVAKGNSASFAPVSVAYAATGNPAGIFDEIVEVDTNNTNNPVKINDPDKSWEPAQLVSKSKVIAMIFTGICTVVAICFVIYNITKLGAAGANDSARSKAKTGLLTSLAAVALMGGLTIIIGFFWNILVTI